MKNKKRILAIDPGTRYIGFAFLEGPNLIHCGVKTIPSIKRGSEMLRLGREFITRMISDYHADILVVEKTFFGNNRHSVLLNTFARQIYLLGKKKGLTVLSIAANTVRKAICTNGAASKDEVANAIALRFPELKPYLTSNRRWKERYYRNMFDAIALGVVNEWGTVNRLPRK